MSIPPRQWPEGLTGDVFRRLQELRFDFEKTHPVEFYVDFQQWPPANEALEWLAGSYGDLQLYDSDQDEGGSVRFVLVGYVSYEGIVQVLSETSEAMARYGGKCDSWGVMMDSE